MTSHEPCPDCRRHIERAEKAETALAAYRENPIQARYDEACDGGQR